MVIVTSFDSNRGRALLCLFTSTVTVVDDVRAGFPPSVALTTNDVTKSVLAFSICKLFLAVISPVLGLIFQKSRVFPENKKLVENEFDRKNHFDVYFFY